MKPNNSFLHLGFSSVIMVFTMIFLMTFAAMSLLTANTDYRLAKKAAADTSMYYSACNTAEALLSKIDHDMEYLYTLSDNEIEYQKLVKSFFSNTLSYSSFSVVNQYSYDKDSYDLFFSVIISEDSNLEIELNLHYPNTSDPTYYTITKYRTAKAESAAE